MQSTGKQLSNLLKLQQISPEEILKPTLTQTVHHIGTQTQIPPVALWVANTIITSLMKPGFYLFALL